jgi:hypothetical protein
VSGIAKPRYKVCGICGEGTVNPTRMCRPCSDAYEESGNTDGSVMEAMLWAARRSRWYQQRRKRRRR